MTKEFKAAMLVEERRWQQRLTYTMPFDRTKLSYVFDVLQKAKQSGRYGIADYTVQQTSLEQVFLRISNNEIMSRKPQLPGMPLAENDDDGSDDGALNQRAQSSFLLYEEGHSASSDPRGELEMVTDPTIRE